MNQQIHRFKNIAKGVADEGIEALESGVKTQAQQTASSVSSQFTGSDSSAKPKHTEESKTDGFTKEVVQDFYEPSDPETLAKIGHNLPKAGQLSLEEEKRKKELQMELHRQNYLAQLYDRTTQEQEHEQKEQIKEEEKKMEELKLEEKKKDDEDIALKMATNKTEQYPGVAG